MYHFTNNIRNVYLMGNLQCLSNGYNSFKFSQVAVCMVQIWLESAISGPTLVTLTPVNAVNNSKCRYFFLWRGGKHFRTKCGSPISSGLPTNTLLLSITSLEPIIATLQTSLAAPCRLTFILIYSIDALRLPSSPGECHLCNVPHESRCPIL